MIFHDFVHFTHFFQKSVCFCIFRKNIFLECEKIHSFFMIFLIGSSIPRLHPFLRSFLSLPASNQKYMSATFLFLFYVVSGFVFFGSPYFVLFCSWFCFVSFPVFVLCFELQRFPSSTIVSQNE